MGNSAKIRHRRRRRLRNRVMRVAKMLASQALGREWHHLTLEVNGGWYVLTVDGVVLQEGRQVPAGACIPFRIAGLPASPVAMMSADGPQFFAPPMPGRTEGILTDGAAMRRHQRVALHRFEPLDG